MISQLLFWIKIYIFSFVGFGTESLVLDKSQMRDFMKEFLHECKQVASVGSPVKPSIPEVRMVWICCFFIYKHWKMVQNIQFEMSLIWEIFIDQL